MQLFLKKQVILSKNETYFVKRGSNDDKYSSLVGPQKVLSKSVFRYVKSVYGVGIYDEKMPSFILRSNCGSFKTVHRNGVNESTKSHLTAKIAVSLDGIGIESWAPCEECRRKFNRFRNRSTYFIYLNKMFSPKWFPLSGVWRNIANSGANSRAMASKVTFTARGLIPPVFTPLHDDLTINLSVIQGYASYLADNGIKSVLVGGTTGENMSLCVDDRKKLVDEWVKARKRTGLHIQVQVGGAPLADVLELARYSEKAGADSILTLPELYFRPTSIAELVFYLQQVSKAAPTLPLLYYHYPKMTKVELNMPEFVAAANEKLPNFMGLKFTSNDMAEGAQVLRRLREDQQMFVGNVALLAPAQLLGIKSSIGTAYNLFPRLGQEIVDAVEKSDVPRARALQEKMCLAIEAHSQEGGWVPTMKAGMEIVSGIKVGPPSLPQIPISEEAKKRIADRLRKMGLAN